MLKQVYLFICFYAFTYLINLFFVYWLLYMYFVYVDNL